VFGLTVEDAAAVAQLAAGFDASDPYARPEAARFSWTAAAPAAFRFGVPARGEREFFGDQEAEKLFESALARLEALGGVPVEVAMEPFFQAARLLYDGPWIAERLSGLQTFVDRAPEALLPITRQILEEGRRYPGVEVFSGLHQLAALQQQVSALWETLDLLAVPTTPTIYTIAQIAEEPRSLNARLGLYTNFVNLLDLAAISVPAGFRGDGLPAGLSLIGPWGSDARLAAVGSRFHQSVGGKLGATSAALPAPPPATAAGAATALDSVRLAVAGAHLRGQPLNHQLTDLGARLLRAVQTAPCYRLYRLPTTPPKPGLVRVQSGGVNVAVEVWELPSAAFGAFFRAVTPPLAIGTVELADGEKVPGFVCEAYAADGARDISSFGGWRAFLAAG
jgi:allophanate hydrolase